MMNMNWYNSKNFNPANHAVEAILLYLRAMYIFNSDLGFSVWEENSTDQPDNLTKLVITDGQAWDTTHRGHLPSIVLRRNTVTFGGGIQDGGNSRQVQGGFGLETSVMEIVTVPMVLSCIARNDSEAESLAFLTAQFMWDDHDWMKSFRLFGMLSPQITKPQPYQLSENAFICDIITAFNVQKSYTMHRLPKTKLEILSLHLNDKLNAQIQA